MVGYCSLCCTALYRRVVRANIPAWYMTLNASETAGAPPSTRILAICSQVLLRSTDTRPLRRRTRPVPSVFQHVVWQVNKEICKTRTHVLYFARFNKVLTHPVVLSRVRADFGWTRFAEHGAMDLRRASAFLARTGAARQVVEKDRESDQDAHRGTDPDPCPEILSKDREGEAERGSRGDCDGRQGKIVA